MRTKLLVAGTLVLLLGFTVWLLIPKGRVTLVPAKLVQGTISQFVSASSTVEAWQNVALSFPVGGRLAQVNVARGDQVQAGSLLASEDPVPLQASADAAAASLQEAQAKLSSLSSPSSADLSSLGVALANAKTAYADAQGTYQAGITVAQATYSQARNTLNYDQTALTQAENLYGWSGSGQPIMTPQVVAALNLVETDKAKLVSAQTAVANPVALQTPLDQTKAALDAAQNAYNLAVNPPTDAIAAAQGAVDGAQAAYQGAQYALDNAALIAPFAGSVTASPFKAGETVAGGTPVVSLTGDGTSLKVVAQVDETQVDKLRIGGKAQVTSGDLPGSIFQGQIVQIAPAAIQVNGVTVFPVDVAVSGPGLRPGMDADVKFMVTAKDALYLPKAYVQKHENLRGLCLGNHFILVSTGLSDSRNLQVVSPALRAEESIFPKGGCPTKW